MHLEKQSGFITGVKCDLCGEEHDGDFTYYSLDIREVTVVNNRNPVGVSGLPIIFSLDACHKCVVGLGDTIRVHYSPTRVGVNCDLCGAQMRGDFTFYYIVVSSIVVNMSGGSTKCSACGRGLSGVACPCGAGRPIKVADMVINDKYLQLVVCPRDYGSMSESAAAIRTTDKR